MSQFYEAEAKTRRKRIDPRLAAAGWSVTPFVAGKPLTAYDRCAVTEYPTANGPADYALFVGGVIFGIVEAKKVTLGPQNVLTQAQRYSEGATGNSLAYGPYYVPFLYSTNGEAIWFADVRHSLNRSRQVAGFHTSDALFEMLGRNFAQEYQWFGANPNDHPRLRPYQVDANAAIEVAISEQKRLMLAAMATGTGKTLTLVNGIYRLMKSQVAKRVLFLVDRRALSAQAVRAFASFEAEPGHKFDQIYEVYSQRFMTGDLEEGEAFDSKVLPASYLTAPHNGLAFVYVCTIQRMAINLFGRDVMLGSPDGEAEDDAVKLSIPIHAFDVIVADECHRGYTSAEASLFRKTLEHFDAIKIGLTATPAAHTKAYFQDIVYRYEYERAVREGFLVDYDVVSVSSNIRMNGVFLREGEEVGVIDPLTGEARTELLDDERHFDTSEIEEKVTAPDSNRKILEEINAYALAHEEKYGRFPKMLIFAANDLPHTSHADQLVNIARDVFGRGDSFVQKITGRVDRPLQRIREFRNRPAPGIVVTVDMLTTGVDIPDLEYIVFLRPVKSRILFEQMLGRGTRKGEKFSDKSHFTVFDCFDGTLVKYFAGTTGITAEPPEKEGKTVVQVIDDIYQNRDRAYSVGVLIKRLQRIDKQMSGEAREEFEAFLPDGDVAKYAAGLPQKFKDAFGETIKLLRDANFQHLLMNYRRPPRLFLEARDAYDIVASEWLIHGGDGKAYKPEDYLTAFTRFVNDNADEIEAIQILLARPSGWNTGVLGELRAKLKQSPVSFTEDNLQRAHRIRYHKALADIISMVKHAAKTEEPLLTAEERVARAVATVTADEDYTEEQRQWLDRIKEHLVKNLSIEQGHFDVIPILSRAGGWGKANKVFNSGLGVLLTRLNEAVAV